MQADWLTISSASTATLRKTAHGDGDGGTDWTGRTTTQNIPTEITEFVEYMVYGDCGMEKTTNGMACPGAVNR